MSTPAGRTTGKIVLEYAQRPKMPSRWAHRAIMATVALRATAATAGVELPFSVTVMHFQDQTELPFRSEEDIINFYHCTLVVTLR